MKKICGIFSIFLKVLAEKIREILYTLVSGSQHEDRHYTKLWRIFNGSKEAVISSRGLQACSNWVRDGMCKPEDMAAKLAANYAAISQANGSKAGDGNGGTGASGMNFISMQVRRRGTREYFALEK